MRITYKVPDGQTTFGTVKLNSGGSASSSVYEEIGEATGTAVGALAETLGTYNFVSWTEDSPQGNPVSTEPS